MVKTPPVGQVMSGDVVKARPDTSVKELVRLLTGHRISGLPVVDDDDKVVGVVSRTDLTRLPGDGAGGVAGRLTAGALMTTPAVTVHPEQCVAVAARVMERRHVDRLPVVDEEDRLVGIATRRDLLRVFRRTDDEIRSDVAAEVSAHLPASGGAAVRVRVKDGVVTLQGLASPSVDPFALLRAAWRVEGVVGVTHSRPLDDTA
ncbi:CBS domain-containing protein [Streptomyces racemochromogenes]|uniref:CBS domain-containing protein n=1 Tax=Streptomyces racemochromogenes TaxID=67353 RepID=A0ABW7P7V5_9ACTN